MSGGRLAGAGRLVVVGPGRLGLSLAAAVQAAGAADAVEVRGRSDRRPPFLAAWPEIAYAAGPGPLPGPGDCIVFAVPDDALEAACRAWAESAAGTPPGPALPAAPGASHDAPEAPRPPVALHTSGVHASGLLEPLRRVGMAAASWHPLTAVAHPDPAALRGLAWGVEGDPAARERAGAFTRSLEGRILPVEPGGHARYHAAAVFASNFLVACLGAARDELAGALEAEGEARLEDLLPLARAAMDEVEREGLRAGLTGPVARGDVGTVRAHLEALGPERRALYLRLARQLLGLVGPGLPPERARALEEALADEEGRVTREEHP